MDRLTKILIGAVLLGLVLAIGADTNTEMWGDWVPLDAAREIGAGLVTGAMIGGVLHEIAEKRRDEHDSDLEAQSRRHALAAALATTPNLAGITLAGQELSRIALSKPRLEGS